MTHQRRTMHRLWLVCLCMALPLCASAFSGCEVLGGLDGDASDVPLSDSGGTSGDTSGSTSGANTGDAATVCARWNADRAFLAEGDWTGSVSACDPGDVLAPGRANALRQLNLVRWLAGQPPVVDDAQQSAEAQACALVTHATERLTHTPDPSSACYSQAAADGAGASNISAFPGVGAVYNYMVDPGNATTFGHRRWLLANRLGSVGLGSTDSYSCLHVFGAQGSGSQAWVAWPPPGAFPIDAAFDGFTSLSETGWTIQSDDIDLSTASATITLNGQALSTQTNYLLPDYGAKHALAIVPQGWGFDVGASYRVEVSGASAPISYTVEVVRCD
jgi:hypothetical protein